MTDENTPGADDDDVARLLRAAGPREQLPVDMQQRWEARFRSELQLVLLARRKPDRRRWFMGLCASLALLLGAFVLTRTPAPETALAVRISHASGRSQMLAPGAGAQTLATGQIVLPGTHINTGADGLVAIRYGAYDLRLNRHTRLLVESDRLVLESGELYASNYGSARSAQMLRINTAQATIRDIGTQFIVIAYPDRTVTTVRRGAVLVDTGREEIHARPQPGSAARLTIDRAHAVLREQVAPDGAGWHWIYLGGTSFRLEGKTVNEFLEWSVGESGLRLEYASHGAELMARSTRLHGKLNGLNPEQAVQPVLASTDLVAERTPDNTLRVTVTR
jgi:hypothetical protein